MELLSAFESFLIKKIHECISEHPVIRSLQEPKPPEPQSRRYLTRKHAAEWLDYSVGTIDRFAREGKITPIYLAGNRSVRYDIEELDRLRGTIKESGRSKKRETKGSRHK